MNFQTLKLQQDGECLRVTLNNPPINLINIQMTQELFQLGGHLHTDPSVKVVLFDSADPDFFLAHFDLDDLVKSAADPGSASKYPDINVLQSLALSWRALPQVKIAKIAGRVRGGGLEFVLGAMDMRFASEEALLCFPEASGGFLASGGGTTLSTLMAGPSRALEILLSSRDFSGLEAERYGLVNRALPVAELDTYVQDLIVRVLRRSPEVIAMHRAAMAKVTAFTVEPLFAGFAAENDGLRAAIDTPAFIGGVEGLRKIGQTRENELDLPATLARLQS